MKIYPIPRIYPFQNFEFKVNSDIKAMQTIEDI